MKVVTILGTRPEIIRLSQVIKRLDTLSEHILVHTGQNFHHGLNEVFFEEMDIRAPDVRLQIQTHDFAEQIGQIFCRSGEILDRVQPDRVLVLGDTNSGLSAIVAARKNIPVYHMEAGNRCYDNRVAEEINRRLIDHCSTVLLPYTSRSKENLVREGIELSRIFVTGNPIHEVMNSYSARIDQSDALQRFEVAPDRYFLATIHRSENVDNPKRLAQLFEALGRAGKHFEQPVLVSLHPRTAQRLAELGWQQQDQAPLILVKPLGFFDFVKLEQNARCVLTDSGTVQEECCLLKVPTVTLRDVTERPETIEAGSNILSGADPDRIAIAVQVALSSNRCWRPPPEYLEQNCAEKVTRILLGYDVCSDV